VAEAAKQTDAVAQTSTPKCPVCGSTMVRRTARQGPHAGRDFWGCSRFSIDECSGVVDIGPAAWLAGKPGEFAQTQFERRRQRHRRWLKAALPAVVGCAIILSWGVFLAGYPYLGLWAGIVGLGVCVGTIVLISRLPTEALLWAKGASGERKTSELLDALMPAGFVVLYGREMPDRRGDIDAIAIGPTGVWVVETKNLSGGVSVAGERLFVNAKDRQSMVVQVYREAFAVQQIVNELLAPSYLVVAPVLCIHGARMLGRNHSVAGVRLVSGWELARLVVSGPAVLNPALVQYLADRLDRKLREPWAWEVKT
jgi:hypothetical protein